KHDVRTVERVVHREHEWLPVDHHREPAEVVHREQTHALLGFDDGQSVAIDHVHVRSSSTRNAWRKAPSSDVPPHSALATSRNAMAPTGPSADTTTSLRRPVAIM